MPLLRSTNAAWTEATEPGRRSQLRQLADANIPV
jgi:hypothetical protein